MNLKNYTETYQNTEKDNNNIYTEFSKNTNEISFLKQHRDYIEKNNLGFGERAFQFMWYTLINDLANKNQKLNLLEIGVFKGQIISLWSLIGKKMNIDVNISGITPLEGNPKSKNKLKHAILNRISSKYRIDNSVGNHFENEDYLDFIKKLFEKFELNFHKIKLYKGFSNDRTIIQYVEKIKYDIIYIDGDHSYEGACFDIENYSPFVTHGGFLVIDDASSNIPGSIFWKGIQSVSDACEHIKIKEFKNVLNVGHNRVYQKI